MGGMRLPRPTGIYVPSSPRTLTNDMISPPLSPEFSFDSETVTPSLLPALEYISSKLQQRMMHVTLLIGRGKPYPTGQPSDLMIIPIHTIEPQAWRVLERAIAKASKKFSLGPGWTDAISRSQYERQANDHLVKQSILQNEVIFSQEGLTLLNMDRIYTFKRRMCILSTRPFSRNNEQSMSSCIRLLHRIVADFSGRPFSKAFFHRIYEQLDVPDEQLTAVAVAYKNVHNQDAIILPPKVERVLLKPKADPIPIRVKAERHREVKRSPIQTVRGRRHPPPSMRGHNKRGPKTPLSASDVTPITRNEWNILVSQDIRVQPKVTKWTPSPTVLAAA
ncbi:Pc13g03740 [Penicillium rubens Wisconsin 54-1255]|uniref:Pc13g03740 protein n=1 Tax=Penicillium rubens (strain ATCC 28089 / DSM 1075 / NRRL 1951 / Wisconsin 54-1255) TaxID=500485 RepID=B6H221_PENRW|nr:Pc13g03740 [Penicillium rubens Wisconsin 54-1255]